MVFANNLRTTTQVAQEGARAASEVLEAKLEVWGFQAMVERFCQVDVGSLWDFLAAIGCIKLQFWPGSICCVPASTVKVQILEGWGGIFSGDCLLGPGLHQSSAWECSRYDAGWGSDKPRSKLPCKGLACFLAILRMDRIPYREWCCIVAPSNARMHSRGGSRSGDAMGDGGDDVQARGKPLNAVLVAPTLYRFGGFRSSKQALKTPRNQITLVDL